MDDSSLKALFNKLSLDQSLRKRLFKALQPKDDQTATERHRSEEVVTDRHQQDELTSERHQQVGSVTERHQSGDQGASILPEEGEA